MGHEAGYRSRIDLDAAGSLYTTGRLLISQLAAPKGAFSSDLFQTIWWASTPKGKHL